MPTSNAFDELRIAFQQAGIEYAVGGSWASTAFGDPRFTNDIDILASLTMGNLDAFLQRLPATFYVDPDEARKAIQNGRPFNLIHMPTVFKFDLFPADAFPLGQVELERAVSLSDTGLSKQPTRFVTPEDILLAKLHWFKTGGEVSEVQWRDIQGIIRTNNNNLDFAYLQESAAKIGVTGLLEKAFQL